MAVVCVRRKTKQQAVLVPQPPHALLMPLPSLVRICLPLAMLATLSRMEDMTECLKQRHKDKQIEPAPPRAPSGEAESAVSLGAPRPDGQKVGRLAGCVVGKGTQGWHGRPRPGIGQAPAAVKWWETVRPEQEPVDSRQW